jgi:motility quorum-sensing regulator/GCU-specific mRNA interferase toxin
MHRVEKRRPHYDLARIRADVARLGPAAFTKTALDGGRAMGLTSAKMLAVIASLTGRNFYKSMTSYADPRVWQDVYYAILRRNADPEGRYIKITLRETAPVIQFKER